MSENRVVIFKQCEALEYLEPRTWKGAGKLGKLQHPLGRGKLEGEVVFACCSNYHIASLKDHEINKYGRVVPSLVCPEKDCGFHEFVMLEGW